MKFDDGSVELVNPPDRWKVIEYLIENLKSLKINLEKYYERVLEFMRREQRKFKWKRIKSRSESLMSQRDFYGGELK